jgi:hypothetical protein
MSLKHFSFGRFSLAITFTFLFFVIILLGQGSRHFLPSTPQHAQAQSPDWTPYDNSDPIFQYGIGDWQHVQVAEASNGSLSFTEVTGGNVDIPFTGTGIELIYAQTIGGSTFKTQLYDANGNEIPGTLRLTDSNGANYSYGHTVTYDQLPQGSYTLAVVNGPGALAVDGVREQAMLPIGPQATPTPFLDEGPLEEAPATYNRPTIPFRELWINLKDLSANLSRWDNYNIIGDNNCLTTLTDSSPNNPALASDPDKNSELMSRYNYLELLRRYGVEIDHVERDASLAEIEALYLAVSKVGSALDGLVSPIGAPVAFGHVYLTRAAFTGAAQPYMENYPSRFLLVRFTNQINNPDSDPNNTCKFRGLGGENGPGRIDCHGTRPTIEDPTSLGGYNEYLFVHELGHFLDNLTRQFSTTTDSLEKRVNKANLLMCNTAVSLLGTFNGVFRRGEEGWGSSYIDQGNIAVSDFQQNPFRNVDETLADMFLNWVYRRRSDPPPASNPCADQRNGSAIWQGFQNIDAAEVYMPIELPGNQRYKWMDDQLNALLQ